MLVILIGRLGFSGSIGYVVSAIYSPLLTGDLSRMGMEEVPLVD